MATDAQLVAALEALVPQRIPYCVNNRFGPACMDCSGVVHRELGAIGVDDGAAAGWTSRTYQDWSWAAKLKLDLAVAKSTPGALLFEGHSDGPGGHIAIVRDAATVFETPCAGGQFFGVSPNSYNTFDAAGAIPGLIYSGHLATLEASATPVAAGGLGSLSGCLPMLLPILAGLGGLSLWELQAHILHL